AEISPGHGSARHLQAAERLAIPGKIAPLVVGNLHLDGERREPLLALELDQLLALETTQRVLDRADGADRTHLGHAPGMEDFDPLNLERLDHRAGRRRSAYDQPLQ